MKFDELDEKMRVYETAYDHCAVPGMLLAARIDGRSFTRLTRETQQFAAPFDNGSWGIARRSQVLVQVEFFSTPRDKGSKSFGVEKPLTTFCAF
jgi:tRNA(His) 5'-end guanylyltransferase